MKQPKGDLENHIGKKIKDLRISMDWSLKDLAEKIDLSPAYLSLLERGLTSINVTTLQSIASAFSMNVNDFFQQPRRTFRCITRSYEREVCYVDGSGYICFSLAGEMDEAESVLEPVVALIPPEKSRDRAQEVSHEGEEFVMVQEGIVTVIIEGKEYVLNPGDSYHIMSKVPHYVGNFTNRMAQLLLVITPKIFERVRKERVEKLEGYVS
jgi:transcriptional regulator with XRE-family HTH domain